MKTTAQLSPNKSPDWGEHLIWLEGGYIPEEKPAAAPPIWQGLALTVIIAALCIALRTVTHSLSWSFAKLLDPIFFSMLVGMLAGNLFRDERLTAGITTAVRKLLPVGIILLGARMNMGAAMNIGIPGLALSVFVVLAALLFFYLCSRTFGLDKELACLLGIGTGICGGTAIVAVAPILAAKDRNVTLGVALVTLVGLIGMVCLPAIAAALQLTQSQFGMLAGLTIHQTPQVIASGFAYGDEAGQVATVTKLTRVCLLAPVAIVLGWWVAHKQQAAQGTRRPWYKLLPGFALGFLILAGFSSLGLLPEISLTWSPAFLESASALSFDTAAVLKLGATFLLAVGMAGVGYQTRFADFKGVELKPVTFGLSASILIAAVIVAIVSTFFV